MKFNRGLQLGRRSRRRQRLAEKVVYEQGGSDEQQTGVELVF
jgi:hypothetical protein